jgi:hypothetical protein
MSRDAKIGLLLVFASITLGLFLGFAEVIDREHIKVNGKDDGDGIRKSITSECLKYVLMKRT